MVFIKTEVTGIRLIIITAFISSYISVVLNHTVRG